MRHRRKVAPTRRAAHTTNTAFFPIGAPVYTKTTCLGKNVRHSLAHCNTHTIRRTAYGVHGRASATHTQDAMIQPDSARFNSEEQKCENDFFFFSSFPPHTIFCFPSSPLFPPVFCIPSRRALLVLVYFIAIISHLRQNMNNIILMVILWDTTIKLITPKIEWRETEEQNRA